ncbi:hypothetical protein [Rhodanobacter lindaniclasticus]
MAQTGVDMAAQALREETAGLGLRDGDPYRVRPSAGCARERAEAAHRWQPEHARLAGRPDPADANRRQRPT